MGRSRGRYAKDIFEERSHVPRYIRRWGKNLAIRFPVEVAKAADLSDGQRVEIISSQDEIVIRKLPAKVTAESMFAGRSAQGWRTLYRAADDWGPDQGRERIEE